METYFAPKSAIMELEFPMMQLLCRLSRGWGHNCPSKRFAKTCANQKFCSTPCSAMPVIVNQTTTIFALEEFGYS